MSNSLPPLTDEQIESTMRVSAARQTYIVRGADVEGRLTDGVLDRVLGDVEVEEQGK